MFSRINIATEGTIAAKADNSGDNAENQMTFYVTSDGYLHLDCWWANSVTSSKPVTGGWTHVAAVFDGDNTILYINGLADATDGWGTPNEGKTATFGLSPLVVRSTRCSRELHPDLTLPASRRCLMESL